VTVSLPIGERTLIMGVINVTPDSFYAGSRSDGVDGAVERALRFEDEGVDILDVGGESTRPGSSAVSVDEEIRRVIPVIEKIKEKTRCFISVDTYRAPVAERAAGLDVQMINDISGLKSESSSELARVVAERGMYIVLMHMRGTPRNMQEFARYTDICREVSDELDESLRSAESAGISRKHIILDPGIGFAKNAGHNLSLIKWLPHLRQKGYPILVGLSRKSFLKPYSGNNPEDRLTSTIAANTISIFQGADIIRVHDVWEAVETARLVDDIKKA
jgi:dihydropteroate synthase